MGVGISPSQIDVSLPVRAALDEINEVQWLKHMNWLCIVKVGQSCQAQLHDNVCTVVS